MVKGTLFLDAASQAQLEECDMAFVIGLKGNDGGTQAQIMELGGKGTDIGGVRQCLTNYIVHIVEDLSGEDDPYKAIMQLMRFKDEIDEKAKERIPTLVGKAAAALRREEESR